MRRISLFAVLILLAVAPIVLAQGDCPVNIPQNFIRADRACEATERGEACYGSGQVSAEISEDADASFAQPGDIAPADTLTQITVGQPELDARSYGIVAFKLQANLVSEQPRREVAVWAFGNVVMTNAVTLPPTLTVTSTGTLNLRTLPALDADIVAELGLRETVTAHGRTQDNRWLRVLVPRQETLAWVAADVGTLSDPISTLDVITDDTPYRRPYQVMTVRSGSSDSPCDGVPDSGVLIQTPNDFTAVDLFINDAILSVTGTIFVQADDSTTTVNVIDGRADVIAGGIVGGILESVPAGARTIVNETPSDAEGYDADDLLALPLDNLPDIVTVPAPTTDEQIAAALAPQPLTPDATATPVDRSRCVRTVTRTANLRGGPANFYEIVGELDADSVVVPVFQQTDADGNVWWQIRTAQWVRADATTSAGDCDDIPRTTVTTGTPQENSLDLLSCESGNGPLRVGQRVTISFTDGSWPTAEETRQAPRVAPARITIGTTALRVSTSRPFLVSEERWFLRFTALWVVPPGSFEIVGQRGPVRVSCNVTIPFGR